MANTAIFVWYDQEEVKRFPGDFRDFARDAGTGIASNLVIPVYRYSCRTFVKPTCTAVTGTAVLAVLARSTTAVLLPVPHCTRTAVDCRL